MHYIGHVPLGTVTPGPTAENGVANAATTEWTPDKSEWCPIFLGNFAQGLNRGTGEA